MTLVLALLLAAAPGNIDAGPLQTRAIQSRTQQVFSIVDHLSNWSRFNHQQYRRWFGAPEQGGLSADDEAALAEHAALRTRTGGWGALDRALGTELSLEPALAAAVREKVLTPADADVERRVLARFEPRIAAFIQRESPRLQAAAEALAKRAPELRAFAEFASRFFGTQRVDLPVFLVPSPGGSGGGGFNGGRLVVEVGADRDPFFVVLHEAWHAFSEPKRTTFEAAARATPGLDFETLSEGFAYAVAPGLFRDRAILGDPLAASLRTDVQDRRRFSADPYARFNRLGLALRPLVKDALATPGATFDSTLPAALAIFRALLSIADAEERTDYAIFAFIPEPAAIMPLLGKHQDVWGRTLNAKDFTAFRPMFRPQDVVLLGLAGSGEIAAEVAAYAGGAFDELAKERAAKPSGERRIERAGEATLLVVWAPTSEALVDAVKTSKLVRAIVR